MNPIAADANPEKASPGPAPSPGAAFEPLAVVGGGNCAHALASHLAHRGHPVHLLVRDPSRLPILTRNGTVAATGALEGEFRLEGLHHCPKPVLKACETVFVATLATAYDEVAGALAPSLRPGHRVVLFSAKFAGSLAFEQSLRAHGVEGVRAMETDALFASRLQPDGSVWVRGIKRWNLVATPRRRHTNAALRHLSRFFAGLEAAENLVQRGLTDFGALAHPLTMVANMNQVDRSHPFLFYCEGFTERTVALLEGLEGEFQRVAEAYGTSLLPAARWLELYYGCEGPRLLDAMRSVPNYQTSAAPTSLDHRYIHEDVSCTLVPVRQLARLAGVDTPLLDAVVAMASVLNGRDYAAEGRTLELLGWGHLTRRQILDWMAS